MFRSIAVCILCLGLIFTPVLAGGCDDLLRLTNRPPTGPVFLASYPTATAGPLRDTAFLYDNALATIALSACGHPDQGRRIGDAMLAALDHDRFWHDGRLRNAYQAGSAADRPIKLAGWWEPQENRWVEDRYQVGSDAGNLAWAVLALLTLDETASDRRYRHGAERLGAWLAARQDARGPGGFAGGVFGFETAPVAYSWKSTEHNVDLAAAFMRLRRVTGDAHWDLPAKAAAAFVFAMWRPDCACFAAGTVEDGKTRNPLAALDAQVLPHLALTDAKRYDATRALTWLQKDGGYAYDESKGGLWTEGTAQVALLLALSGQTRQAATLRRRLETRHRDAGYLAAAGTAGTAFKLDTDPTQKRSYPALPHLGATAWVALATRRYNPFTGNNTLP